MTKNILKSLVLVFLFIAIMETITSLLLDLFLWLEIENKMIWLFSIGLFFPLLSIAVTIGGLGSIWLKYNKYNGYILSFICTMISSIPILYKTDVHGIAYIIPVLHVPISTLLGGLLTFE